MYAISLLNNGTVLYLGTSKVGTWNVKEIRSGFGFTRCFGSSGMADRIFEGRINGHPVKDGVYFVYVKARGADGRDYNIRRDVNLLRNFNTVDNTNP